MITFADLIRELDSTGVLFTAYGWADPEPLAEVNSWGAVFVTGSKSLYGDGAPAEEVLTGTISMATRQLDASDFGAVTAKLQELSDRDDIAYRFVSTRYDEGKALLYYDWRYDGVLLNGFE